MGIGGIWQWVVVLAIILLLFGTKKLRNLGSDLGHAVKGFRKGMRSESDDKGEDKPVGVPDQTTAHSEAEVSADAEKPAPEKSAK